MTDEAAASPAPMEAHREISPSTEHDETTVIEGEWLYTTLERPESLGEIPECLPPWLKLNTTNAGWLATEVKYISGIPDCWTFVPESPMTEDFRVDRLALVAPSNVWLLRWTRVGFGRNKRWEWRLHGPDLPEERAGGHSHGILDMIDRGWIHIWEDALLLENGAGETRVDATVCSQTAQSLWSKLANQDHPSVPPEHKGLIDA